MWPDCQLDKDQEFTVHESMIESKSAADVLPRRVTYLMISLLLLFVDPITIIIKVNLS